MTGARPGRVVASLGTAQTLAWASSYYLPAVLAQPMARDLGLDVPTVYLAFSTAMGVTALVGPWAGRTIDRHGGRPVLIATNVAFAAGLVALGCVREAWGLFAAWGLIGLAMGCGLYEAAFATVVRLHGAGSRNMITGITLFAGFASTVGWPLSAWMEARWGWRGACLGWAALHLAIALPLNAWLPRAAGPDRAARGGPAAGTGTGTVTGTVTGTGTGTGTGTAPAAAPTAPTAGSPPMRGGERTAMGLLAFVFAATWFISTAMAAHFPRMMEAAGTSLATAVAVGALIGPAQVAARLLEFGLLRRMHPLLSARAATLGHPVGAVALLVGGPALAPAFAILHGAGNGMMTIAKGTLPLVLFGPVGYGARQGWLLLPARVAQSIAPYLFGLALDRWGAATLWGSTLLGLLTAAALWALRAPVPQPARGPDAARSPGS